MTTTCFLREPVILNGCEGSQKRVKERCFALLSMTNNIWVNIYIIAKVKTATSAKGRRFNFSFILINNYSSSPQSKPVGASMQGKVQEPLFLCKRNHSYGTAM